MEPLPHREELGLTMMYPPRADSGAYFVDGSNREMGGGMSRFLAPVEYVPKGLGHRPDNVPEPMIGVSYPRELIEHHLDLKHMWARVLNVGVKPSQGHFGVMEGFTFIVNPHHGAGGGTGMLADDGYHDPFGTRSWLEHKLGSDKGPRLTLNKPWSITNELDCYRLYRADHFSRRRHVSK